MLRIATRLLALGAISLAACGDDPVKPGEIVVKWNHGLTSATCGTRSVTTVEARAMKGEEEVAVASGACPAADASGTLTLADVAPGSYRIEVEAFDANNKGTYLGILAKQNVSEGKSSETPVIELKQKPAIINVDWTLPGNGRCSTAGIAEIEVFLFYHASTAAQQQGTPKKVGCDTTGMQFTDLVPNADVQLIAYGYDSAKKRIAKGTSPFFALTEGDDLDKVIALETCPGDPPACN